MPFIIPNSSNAFSCELLKTRSLFGTNTFSIVCKKELTYLVAATGIATEKNFVKTLSFFRAIRFVVFTFFLYLKYFQNE
jgi:hypothetical protein